ncbi:hypothetical protein QVD17_23563 [Tagetes erecta]|uniref:Uncharacterized protein n=1 Tax=Tagetes erecta TaxID=13708 RepID=A0AAD8NMC1_TARER|nr:hypothetical protein QVD17_23563 [Tagetes erecta]
MVATEFFSENFRRFYISSVDIIGDVNFFPFYNNNLQHERESVLFRLTHTACFFKAVNLGPLIENRLDVK